MPNELQVAAALLSCGLDSVETIVCTAGAWAGGSVASEEGLQAVDRSVDIASLPAELLLMAGMPNKLLLLSWAYQRARRFCVFFLYLLSRVDPFLCRHGWGGSMWQANVQSAVTTAHLATRFLGTNGLVVFSGAGAALGPTPGMAGYGVAKAATHQLARLTSSTGLL